MDTLPKINIATTGFLEKLEFRLFCQIIGITFAEYSNVNKNLCYHITFCTLQV